MEFNDESVKIEEDIRQTQESIKDIAAEVNNNRKELIDLDKRIRKLAEGAGADMPAPLHLQEISIDIEEIDFLLDDVLSEINKKHKKFPKLSAEDMVVSSVAGITAVAIDVFLVGTPKITRIKGGEKFDGSILTKAIRKLGEGPLGGMFKKFETICKVPYDISVVKNGMYPQNHRLRSLGHDPFFGLFFAIFDIIMNTTTFIDNSGCLRILPNARYKSSIITKFLCVFYYIGHIISDLFTARGIPVPGFFLTQFFRNGDADNSIAKIAEKMYIDGYDLRHFASMTTPVIVKNLIIVFYLKLSEEAANVLLLPLAEREKLELDKNLKKEKMNFIANSIAVSGNVAKFFAPPYVCDPRSLNAPEWLAFIKSGINMAQIQLRDSSAEEALENRADIDVAWGNFKYTL